MIDDNKSILIVRPKCFPCYKKDWCMLSPLQSEECLGPFTDVEDSQNKVREHYKQEDEKKADLDGAVNGIILNRYLRRKELFDD